MKVTTYGGQTIYLLAGQVLVDAEALDTLKAMAQRLQEERDELLEVLLLVHQDYSLARYAEDMDFKWADAMKIAIDKCTAKPEILA